MLAMVSEEDSPELEPRITAIKSADADVDILALQETFHIDDMFGLNDYQSGIPVLQYLRAPFPPEFVEKYADVLSMLTQNHREYDISVENVMYQDPNLLDLAQMRQRHEARRVDGEHIEPTAVTEAFWARRNVLAYIIHLENEATQAYHEYPDGESSQQAG
jgi:hypothetical protein